MEGRSCTFRNVGSKDEYDDMTEDLAISIHPAYLELVHQVMPSKVLLAMSSALRLVSSRLDF